MKPESPEEQAFLSQLYRIVKDDLEAQASLYDIGESLGLDRSEAEGLAQALYIQGVAEMKTLSGGMGITVQGLAALDVALPAGATGFSLGRETVLNADSREALDTFLEELKTDISEGSGNYEHLEEMVLDMKTLDVQLLSPRPKTGIIREIFKSLAQNLDQAGAKEAAARLNSVISS